MIPSINPVVLLYFERDKTRAFRIIIGLIGDFEVLCFVCHRYPCSLNHYLRVRIPSEQEFRLMRTRS